MALIPALSRFPVRIRIRTPGPQPGFFHRITSSVCYGAACTPTSSGATCPAVQGYQSRTNWPATGGGLVATGTCATGYTAGPNGPPTRQCLSSGAWSATVTNNCDLGTVTPSACCASSLARPLNTCNPLVLFFQPWVLVFQTHWRSFSKPMALVFQTFFQTRGARFRALFSKPWAILFQTFSTSAASGGSPSYSRITSVSATATSASSLTLTWTAEASATQFRIFYTMNGAVFTPVPPPPGYCTSPNQLFLRAHSRGCGRRAWTIPPRILCRT